MYEKRIKIENDMKVKVYNDTKNKRIYFDENAFKLHNQLSYYPVIGNKVNTIKSREIKISTITPFGDKKLELKINIPYVDYKDIEKCELEGHQWISINGLIERVQLWNECHKWVEIDEDLPEYLK